MNNIEEAYIKGFIKRANAHGYTNEEAVEIVKQAMPISMAALGALLGKIKEPIKRGIGAAASAATPAMQELQRAVVNPANGYRGSRKIIQDLARQGDLLFGNIKGRAGQALSQGADQLYDRATQGVGQSFLGRVFKKTPLDVGYWGTKKVVSRPLENTADAVYGAGRRGLMDLAGRLGLLQKKM